MQTCFDLFFKISFTITVKTNFLKIKTDRFAQDKAQSMSSVCSVVWF